MLVISNERHFNFYIKTIIRKLYERRKMPLVIIPNNFSQINNK